MPLLPDVLPAGPLELRRWRPDMARAMAAAVTASFPELHQWMPWAVSVPTTGDMLAIMRNAERSFEADEEWQYVLTETAGAEVVGGAGLDRAAPDHGPGGAGRAVMGSAGLHPRVGPGGAEIGYWVRTDRTGRGYATAAAWALTDAAFRFVPAVDHVEIHMDRANTASAAVPRKLGFRLEREEDRPLLAPEHTGRGLVWTLTRAEWARRRSTAADPD